MNGSKTESRLLDAATDLFRRNGFVGTSVDEICAAAGVTKGGFFHHFRSKEELAERCLEEWDRLPLKALKGATYHQIADPVDKLLACLDTLTGFFSQPGTLKSCLAGTTLQEVSESHPRLRAAAFACLVNGENRLKILLDGACAARGVRTDTASLASLWMAALQGSLIRAKGSGDETVIRQSLEHVRHYIASLVTK